MRGERKKRIRKYYSLNNGAKRKEKENKPSRMEERAEGETFVVLRENEDYELASGPSQHWDASVFWPFNRGKIEAAELEGWLPRP